MLYHIKEEARQYITMDDANARQLAQRDPQLFFETYGAPLLIDEFQRAPSILLEIKKIVDQKALSGEPCNGMYWLTGSQKFHMMRGVSESLAGRTAVLGLSSLSTAEIDGRPLSVFDPSIEALKEKMREAVQRDVHQIYQRIFQGGMPKLVAQNVDRDRFYADYVNTYLERDIQDLAQVGKMSQFYEFLVFMAARTGQELKYADISKAIGISAPTAKAWVSILEGSGILYILRPYSSNMLKRLVKTPKCYFMDTGLAAYLCRWASPETLENGAMDGALLETYAISEIAKSFIHAGKRESLYYYRDVDQREIDLLLIRDNKVFPIEIKKSSAPQHPDKNFSVLEKTGLDIQPGIILCMSKELIPYSRNTWYCPISIL